MTLKSRPRYLLIVFAFAGDSTITSAFAMYDSCPLSRFRLSVSLIGNRRVKPDEGPIRGPGHFSRELELGQFSQPFGSRPTCSSRQFVEPDGLSYTGHSL